jgi:hypothetical protein
MNSPATSVARLRRHRSAIVAWLLFSRKNRSEPFLELISQLADPAEKPAADIRLAPTAARNGQCISMGQTSVIRDILSYRFHQLFHASYADIKANRIHRNAPSDSAAGIRSVIQLFAVALGAGSLAACAQSSVVTQKAPSLEHNRTTSVVPNRHLADTTKHSPFASDKNAAETQVASHGLASRLDERPLWLNRVGLTVIVPLPLIPL